MNGNVYPDLVKVFYTNLTLEGRNLFSYVKGVKLTTTNEVWTNIARIKYLGLKVSNGNTIRVQEFNKIQFYQSCVRDPAQPVNRFHAGNLNLTTRILAYVIAWQLTPRDSNHVVLHEEDLIMLYYIINIIKINWVSIMVGHMLKSKRLTDYRFPYAIFVSKLIDCYEVDTTNERNEIIKAVNEIDISTLIKMGFRKEENTWVEHEGSNRDDQDKGNEDLPNAEDAMVEMQKHHVMLGKILHLLQCTKDLQPHPSTKDLQPLQCMKILQQMT